MTTLSWNCQGLGSNLTVRRLEEMCREHFPDFLFILETKNSSDHVLRLQRSLGYDHHCLVNPVGLSGGLALFWRDSYEVEVLLANNRMIDTKVKVGSLSYHMTFVYGDPVQNRRRLVWEALNNIAMNRDGPWFLTGDFNEIMNNAEKKGGTVRLEASFYQFRSMVRDCRIKETPSLGNWFSWAGNREVIVNGERETVWIQCRLDRAFGNAEWFRLFPRKTTEYLERLGSDHKPIISRLASMSRGRTGRFIFDSRWCSNPEMRTIIQKGWDMHRNSGGRSVSDRITSCRKELSRWKRQAGNNSKERLRRLRAELEVESAKLSPCMRKLLSLNTEIAKAFKEEEIYWKQKSGVRWLKVGDKNTKVFHGWVKSRRMRNNITSLKDGNGVEHFEEDKKGEIAIEYFTHLFKLTNPTTSSELLNGLEPRVTSRMNRDLTRRVTENDILKAVKGINADSAPGSDGMTGKFFQHYWDITKEQVLLEVKGFFDHGRLPQDWNFTQICLLPKKPNPSLMTDLRPISLCAVSYKIVSKILCTRLKKLLPSLVSETQGAFVAGRLISDNLLIAHELVHGLRTNPACKSDYISIKTDMSKAYDRVEWNFLEELFLRMGFDGRWVEWVMLCIRSVSYTVLLNGQAHGHIVPERGLRQGDPLSPFLFILCAEALVNVMDKAEKDGRITGMKLSKHCPAIQHLLFADDSLFLCKATLQECSEFLRCLSLYGMASGQEINFQKSSVTFGSKMDPVMKRLLSERLGIDKEGGAGTYLGLPECFSGSKKAMFAFITKKLQKRLKGCYAKTLSLGGKEVLIKSIAMALPVYAMSCFRLTKHQCQKLTSAMASFWWNAVSDKSKIHWMSWKSLCQSKDMGGMGFKEVEGFNQALLAKQAWRLLNQPETLISKVFQGRYFSNKSFLESSLGYRPSYAWRSILFGKELLNKGLGKLIGNGASTSVWSEKWILDGEPRRPTSLKSLYNVELKVSDLIQGNGTWDVEKLNTLFPAAEVSYIRTIQLGNVKDRYIWSLTNNGSYSVRSGYKLWSKPPDGLSPADEEKLQLKRRIWKLLAPPKIKIFWWRAVSGALAVADRLRWRGIQVDDRCKLCNQDVESIVHVLFTCEAAKEIFRLSNIPSPYNGFGLSLTENFRFLLSCSEDTTIAHDIRSSIPWSLWNTWKNRNNLIFGDRLETAQVVANRITAEAMAWRVANSDSNAEHDRCSRADWNGHRWIPPEQGFVKCNVHAEWRSSVYHSGGAWIARDHGGQVLYHARDAFINTPNRLVAEFKCILWAMEALRNLRLHDVSIASDCNMAVEALTCPDAWPRYGTLVNQVLELKTSFSSCVFEEEPFLGNSIARDIAKSVNRYGRFQPYLALGGPAWLHDRLRQEAQ